MLATDVLKRNHRAILDLFDRYRRLGRGDHRGRKDLYDQIRLLQADDQGMGW